MILFFQIFQKSFEFEKHTLSEVWSNELLFGSPWCVLALLGSPQTFYNQFCKF